MYYAAQLGVKCNRSATLERRADVRVLMNELMKKISVLSAVVLIGGAISAAQTVTFTLPAAGEALAEITAASPGAQWGKSGAEAADATLTLDGAYNQDILLYMGAEPWTYRVFLGPLSAGTHRLTLTRNAQWSAAGAGFEMKKAQVRAVLPADPEYAVIAHAPILYARADTLGRFSDAPLMMWYEELAEGEIQYSVIFTNEDGGTPSDALMARWGRGTDIEYVYRVTLDVRGARDEIYQAPDHKDLHFQGKKVGAHPLILIATLNNTFSDAGYTPVQYRMAPQLADLSAATRESVMDTNPWTYRVMAEELRHEGKLREFGAEAPPAIGDPRQYLNLEMKVEVHGAAGVAAWVRRNDSPKWYSSHRGRLDFAISRNGWVRTTIELPPGTRAADVEEVTVECLDLRDPRVSAAMTGPPPECTVQPGKAFFLGDDYVPGRSFVQPGAATRLRAGEQVSLGLAR